MTTASGDASDALSFTAAFPPATHEAWAALAERALKGASVETLVSRSHDGLRVEPLYPKAAPGPQPTRAHGPWRVAQRVDHPDPGEANALALADLNGGADSLTLVLAGAPAARGFGLRIETIDDLERALSGIMLDWIHLRLEAGGQGRQAAAMLIALARRRGHDVAALDLDLGLDPIGAMATTGTRSAQWPVVAGRCAETLAALRDQGFPGRAFLCDGRPAHEAGASEAQELAFVLAAAVAYLRALEAGGHPPDAARDALAFLLVADADEFLTVAKFRALRRLWARVEAACGLSPRPIRLHAETAWRMTTRRDPWVNLLRGTVAAFSAGIGGADAIGVLPFTAALGLPDGFARRIARNTQLILLEESNLWRVADPAAGSGGFEALTAGLYEESWSLFQAMEREGGIVASLELGAVQARIGRVRAERERAVATRTAPLTGTSAFAEPNEVPVAVLFPSPVARLADLTALAPGADPIAPLPSTRAAAPFEALRDRSDRSFAETGARPKVFLANLGPPSSFAARAAFAKNLFEAGGFETSGNQAAATPAEIVAAGLAWLGADPAKRVCLCGANDAYDREGATIAALFRDAGVSFLGVAGRPDEIDPGINDSTVSAFVFEGCDVLAVLNSCSGN